MDLKTMFDLSKNYVPYYFDDGLVNLGGFLNLSMVVTFIHCHDSNDDFLSVFVSDSSAEYFVKVKDVRNSNFSFLADM